MRQVFLEKGAIVVKEVSQPLLDEHCVLVSVEYSFISSGTETATINNAQESIISNIPAKIKKIIEAVSAHGIDGTKAGCLSSPGRAVLSRGLGSNVR